MVGIRRGSILLFKIMLTIKDDNGSHDWWVGQEFPHPEGYQVTLQMSGHEREFIIGAIEHRVNIEKGWNPPK